jgi:VWFA-related protein
MGAWWKWEVVEKRESYSKIASRKCAIANHMRTGMRSVFLQIAACSLFAQQPQDNSSGEATIKLNVRQVLVPVVVTDKKGHFVAGLHASDFQITEDAVPQEIVAFTRETASSILDSGADRLPSRSISAGQPAASPAPRAATQERMWVICFDAVHMSPASFARVRAAMDKLLTGGHQNGDKFVLLSLGERIRVIQTATSDLSVLHGKLASQELTSTFTNSQSSQLTNAVNDLRRRMDSYCVGCACGRDAGNRKDTCDVERQQIKIDLDARSEQFVAFSKAFLAAFKTVVEEFAKLQGQRTLVLISDGFTLMPGAELYATVAAYLPNSPYFKFDPSRNLQPALDESLRVATAHDIVVSAIDTRGVYSASFRPGGISDASTAAPGATGRQEVLARRNATNALRGGSLLEEMDSKGNAVERANGSALARIAEATGGIHFHDSNDLLKGFREALDDRKETYVLAYAPKNSVQDGKFRQITVRVSGAGIKAGDLTVRSKSGYWSEPPKSDR